MRSLILFFAVILFPSSYLDAQKKDSLCVVQFISNVDSAAIEFANAGLELDGILQKRLHTDQNGFASIHAGIKSIMHSEFSLTINGFYDVELDSSMLRMNDTLVIVMKEKPVELNQVEIISYRMPIIEKDTRRKKKKIEVVRTDTAYSPEELEAYTQLLAGKWIAPDSLKNNVIENTLQPQNYFSSHIRYPQKAYDNEAEDIIFMSFELDVNGNPKNLKLLHGKNPAMALEVAKAIAGMPRFDMRYYYDPYNKRYSPLVFVMSFKFHLR